MSEPLDRDTLFKRLRSKPENKASQRRRRCARARGVGDDATTTPAVGGLRRD
jgi:hypothetical protein